MNAGYEQAKEMIRRYDEVISDKANKGSIKEIHEILKQYVKTERLTKIQEGIAKQFEEAETKHEKLNGTLKYVSDNINKDI